MNKTEKEQLFRDIYTNYYHKISRISHGILIEKNSAEDLLQEIFLNIWHSLDKFQGKSSIGTWVYRVAVNSALVHNRRIKSYRREKDVFKQVTHENQTDTIPESNPELMKLKHCISRLQQKDKMIITLSLEGLKYEEIAEIIGESINYTGVKINRIKKQLVKCMTEE